MPTQNRFPIARCASTILTVLAVTSQAEALVSTNGSDAPAGPSDAPPGADAPPALVADDDFRVYWKNSINFETADKKFKIKMGGRLQNDWWFITGEDDALADSLAAPQESGTNFRRARIYMSGTLWENMVFAWAYEFADATPDFKDAYLGWNDVGPLGTVLVGQQKEPIGFEFAYSSNYATFIERGLPHYMNPERSTGVRFYQNAGDEDAVFLTAGAFRPTNDQGSSTLAAGDAWAFSGRAAWSPVFEDKGKKLVHLGVNGSYRTGVNAYAKSARPEMNGMARYIAAAVNDVDGVLIGGLEASANLGALSFQAEYVLNSVDSAAGGTADWSGWYGYVSYFLTGEHRPYRRDRAAYSAVSPTHDLGTDGSGAWELALRYSTLDLTDGDNTLGGGQLDDVTAGVNWYMNTSMRAMLNYIYADVDGVGSSNAIAMRFQVFF